MLDVASVEICLSIASLLGMAGVSRHEFRFLGFILCAIANISWIILGITIGHFPYIILFGGYLIFNTIGAHDEYATWRQVYAAHKNYNK